MLLTLKGVGAQSHTLRCYDTAGHLLGEKTFVGATTTVSLPDALPVVILQVTGPSINTTLKLLTK